MTLNPMTRLAIVLQQFEHLASLVNPPVVEIELSNALGSVEGALRLTREFLTNDSLPEDTETQRGRVFDATFDAEAHVFEASHLRERWITDLKHLDRLDAEADALEERIAQNYGAEVNESPMGAWVNNTAVKVKMPPVNDKLISLAVFKSNGEYVWTRDDESYQSAMAEPDHAFVGYINVDNNEDWKTAVELKFGPETTTSWL